MKRTRQLDTAFGTVEFVSPEEAETCSVCICMEWSFPLILPCNQRATCFGCGKALQHHPSAPRKPRKVCIACAEQYVRPN